MSTLEIQPHIYPEGGTSNTLALIIHGEPKYSIGYVFKTRQELLDHIASLMEIASTVWDENGVGIGYPWEIRLGETSCPNEKITADIGPKRNSFVRLCLRVHKFVAFALRPND